MPVLRIVARQPFEGSCGRIQPPPTSLLGMRTTNSSTSRQLHLHLVQRLLVALVSLLLVTAEYALGHSNKFIASVLYGGLGVALTANATIPLLALSRDFNRANALTAFLVSGGLILTISSFLAAGNEPDGVIFGFFLLVPIGVIMWICGSLRRPRS